MLNILRHMGLPPLDVLRGQSFVEMEIRGSTDLPGYPTLYYLGREAYVKDFLFLLPSGTRQETSILQLSQDRLGTFLYKRLQRHAAGPQQRSIVAIDALLQSAPRFAHTFFTPEVRALLPLHGATAVPRSGHGALPVDRSRQDGLPHLGVRLSRSFADFDLFYEHMYRPTYASFDGDSRHLVEKDAMWRLFTRQVRLQRGHLMLLGEGNGLRCGGIVFADPQRPDTLVLYRGGVLRPDRLSSAALQQSSAQFEQGAAAYARRAGYSSLDLGLTAARRDDPQTARRLAQGCLLQADADAPMFRLEVPRLAQHLVDRHAPILRVARHGGVWQAQAPDDGAAVRDLSVAL